MTRRDRKALLVDLAWLALSVLAVCLWGWISLFWMAFAWLCFITAVVWFDRAVHRAVERLEPAPVPQRRPSPAPVAPNVRDDAEIRALVDALERR